MPYCLRFRRFSIVLMGLCGAIIRTCSATPQDSPGQFRWPTLDPTDLEEIGLVVHEKLFERTHFVIESSCRVTPFERPLDFLDSQVTARWTQSILLQMEPAKHAGFMVNAGLGYSVERATLSSYFGEIVAYSLEPSLLLPLSIAYNRPNRYKSSSAYLQMEWEINPYIFSRTTTIFHRLLAHADRMSLSSLTLYGREKVSSLSPLDTNLEYKYYQIGFMLEHQSY